MPRAEIHDGADLLWILTDIRFAIFNSLLKTRAAPADVPAMIEAAKARARARGVPLMWFIGPGTRPDDLAGRLEAHGFQQAGSMPGMVSDLGSLSGPGDVPPELSVERVGDAASARIWAEVLCEGFDLPGYVRDAFLELLCRVGFGPDAVMRSYLASWNGEPAATSSLFSGAGVAGIYNVATLPAMRGRGIGAAVTRRPLLDAKAAGFATAVLQSSAAGFEVYKRLGFVERCRFVQYYWVPSST